MIRHVAHRRPPSCSQAPAGNVFLGGILLLMVFVGLPRPTFAQPAVLWEFAPYRLRLSIVADDEHFSRALAAHLESKAELAFGPCWELSSEWVPPEKRASVIQQFDSPRGDDPTPNLESGVDKWFIAIVSHAGSDWRLNVRELDVRTHQWGPAVGRQCVQHELLHSLAWHAIAEAFQPLALVDSVAEDEVRLRFRAAGLAETPAHPVLPRKGDTLRPLMRLSSRDGKAQVVPVSWTLLQVTEVGGVAVTARMFSGYRNPLSGRSRGQMQTLALLTRPRHQGTRLSLVSHTDGTPLPGYEVMAQSPLAGALQPLGHSDGQGRITIAPAADALRLLVVKHGDEILARVPIVPGFDADAKLELPDDRKRLEAEGLTIGLQEQVVDLVARRQSLLVAIRQAMSADRLDEAERLLKQLRQLPTDGPLRAELRNHRLRLQTGDAYVQTKITRLFNDTEQVLNTYFDSREIDQVERELAHKRKAK